MAYNKAREEKKWLLWKEVEEKGCGLWVWTRTPYGNSVERIENSSNRSGAIRSIIRKDAHMAG